MNLLQLVKQWKDTKRKIYPSSHLLYLTANIFGHLLYFTALLYSSVLLTEMRTLCDNS